MKKPELSCLPKTKIACHQRFACRTRCGLATEIFPLAQNENSKKERTTYRKPAMSFASCYLLFFSFCFESKQVEQFPLCNKHFSEFCLLWKYYMKNQKSQLKFLNFALNNFEQNRVEASSSLFGQAKHKYLVSRLRIVH